MKDDKENTNRKMAVVYTIGYHGILFLFLFFFILKTPIPPYPDQGGGSGLEVNFGNSDKGYGNNNSEELLNVETQQLSSSSNDNYITQDKEDNSSLNSSKNKTNKTSEIKINDPVVDQSKLYRKKTNANQGIAGGTGNQGKLNGDPNSSNYDGNGGSGGGKGKGNGTGIGDGNGPGTSYDLTGRVVKSLPKPAYNSDEQGKVVVTITVDQSGKVTKAIAGAKGTTVTDKSLWKEAEQAAYKAKFNAKSEAAIEQKGTITYIFMKLN